MSLRILPTVVLVHGAWSQPIGYSKTIKALEAVGFTVYAPALPTCNSSRPPNSSFDQDVDTVRSILDSLVQVQNREVVLLMHSYGGLVGSQAAEGLARKERIDKGLVGGIVAAVYLCAYMCHQKSVRDLIKAAGLEPLLPEIIPHNDDGTCTLKDAEERLYGDLSPEDRAEAIKSTVVFNGKAFFARNTYIAWKDIYSVYVRTTQDVVVPESFQDMFLGDAKDQGLTITVEILQTGHSPHIKDPKSIEEIVSRAVVAASM